MDNIINLQGSITLADVFDGQGGEGGLSSVFYEIFSETEEIIKEISSSGLSLNPSELVISIKKIIGEEQFYLSYQDFIDNDFRLFLTYINDEFKEEKIDILKLYDLIETIKKDADGKPEEDEATKLKAQYANLFNYKPEDKGFSFNLQSIFATTNFIEYIYNDYDEKGQEIQKNLGEFFDTFSKWLKNIDNGVLNIKLIIIESFPEIIKTLTVRFPLTEELARFAILANQITAAVNNTGMKFSKDGLTITNGGFKIEANQKNPNYNIDGDLNPIITVPVFSIEEDSELMEGNPTYSLKISGRGTFAGDVYADDGYFKGKVFAEDGYFHGEIKANSGSLEDVIIQNNPTESERDVIRFIAAAPKDEEKPFIDFNGGIYQGKASFSEDKLTEITNSNFAIDLDGTVTAKNIRLGYNEAEDSSKILTLGYDDEIKESYIKGSNWGIYPEKAYFNNIDVAGTIKASVFEKNSIQLSGSSFLFKDGIFLSIFEGTKIKEEIEADGSIKSYLDVEEIKLTVDGQFFPGNVYLFTNEKRSIYCYALAEGEKNEENEEVVTKFLLINPSNISDKLEEITMALNLGPISLEQGYKPQDAIIGINSSAYVADSFGLAPNGITISEFVPEIRDNKLVNYKIENRVILGNLEQQGYSGYGLFADNVHLRGTLTTEYTTGLGIGYAGINTLSEVPFVKDINKDTSKVIFWAGAGGTDIKDIQDAPFQVTTQGTVYARQALLEESVFAGEKVKAKILEAEIVRGYKAEGTEENPNPIAAALRIYDPDKGIAFYNTEYNETNTDADNEVHLIFEVDSEGIKSKRTISSSREDISFLGETLKLNKQAEINNLIINGKEITYNNNKILFNESNLAVEVEQEAITQWSKESFDIKKQTIFYNNYGAININKNKLTSISSYEKKYESDGDSERCVGIDLYIFEELKEDKE